MGFSGLGDRRHRLGELLSERPRFPLCSIVTDLFGMYKRGQRKGFAHGRPICDIISFASTATRLLIAILPPALLALTAQRYIVRGLTFGAVKG